MTRRPPPHIDEDSATEIYDGPRGTAPVLKVISMKTPAEVAAETSQKTPEVAKPRLRPMRRHPTPPSGNLAPPRTAASSTARRLLSPVALGSILAIAAGVGLVIWLLASR